MRSGLARGFYVACYYLSWFWFAAFAIVFSAACVPLLLVPNRAKTGACIRRVIRMLFKLWLFWFRLCGVLRVSWHGFEGPLPAGAVYVANHPTLLDATFILSKLPDAICVMKPALARNPFIAPATLMAGYVVSDPSMGALLDAAAKVAGGRSLLIFPEGTRTPGGVAVGRLIPAFYICAERARAAIQLIVIRASPGLTPKGRPWWKPPLQLPGWIEFTLDQRWDAGARRAGADLTVEVRSRIRSVLEGE
jgi:1-acyl-sn-glycerol-3-phosphate acyltransferase